MGSPRINTDAIGAVISRHDYHPFGDEIARVSYGADTVRKQFTGYERDIESDLDFAQARYYEPMHGRFTSPDPLMASGRQDNPQTLNRYIYVGNNPLFWVDPTGLIWGKNDDGQVKWFDKKLGKGFSEFTPDAWQYEAADGRIIQLDANSSKWNSIDPVQVVAESNPIQELVGAVAENAETKGRTVRMAATVAGTAGVCAGTAGAGCAGAAKVASEIIKLEMEAAETAAADTVSTDLHGNSLSSLRPTWVYELYSDDGTFLKNGITSKEIPENRYTKGYMGDKEMLNNKLYPNRREARNVERHKNTVNPGPLNRRR